MIGNELYMHRCLQLAQCGAGFVAPNPMVGAVLVYNDRIIGEGYHKIYGQAHAEVNCLESVVTEDRHLIPDSVLYVSLEPCAHYGKTPPCADLIIRHRIKKVVIGCQDPFKAVDGKGIDRLKAAGVTVETGVLEKESRTLNKRFFCFYQQQRPYIILKWARSSNDCISGAGGERIKISNEITDRLVHRWRSEEAAIMVGTTTALKDNPALTNRYWSGHQPTRVLIDKKLSVSRNNAIYAPGAPLIIFNLEKNETDGAARFIRLSPDMPVISQVLQDLYNLQIQSIIIEGGTFLLQSFINENCWDEARVITNHQLIIPGGYAAPVLVNGKPAGSQQIGNDTIEFFENP
jgi:diaminohydroxyphosphoribosylaminopyrimidine deaminase/5-amino-6-(5-phosphoribosylamino)uracil reductase